MIMQAYSLRLRHLHKKGEKIEKLLGIFRSISREVLYTIGVCCKPLMQFMLHS